MHPWRRPALSDAILEQARRALLSRSDLTVQAIVAKNLALGKAADEARKDKPDAEFVVRPSKEPGYWTIAQTHLSVQAPSLAFWHYRTIGPDFPTKAAAVEWLQLHIRERAEGSAFFDATGEVVEVPSGLVD